MNDTAMQAMREAQHKAFLADGFPSAKVRIDRIDRIKDIHVRYKRQIIETLESDFGSRPQGQSLVTDVLSTIMEVKFLPGWILLGRMSSTVHLKIQILTLLIVLVLLMFALAGTVSRTGF
jgi:hypothetical protein